MKVKEFLIDFKEGELFLIDNLDLGELKEEYINLLNEYSLEDLFRDTFGIIDSKFSVSFNLFEIEDINKKLYGDEE
jgi:hypothetical protein